MPDAPPVTEERLLLRAEDLPLAVAGVNHTYYSNHATTEEMKQYSEYLMLKLNNLRQWKKLYLDADLHADLLRRKQPLVIWFTWHFPRNKLWKWDWDGLLKRPQDIIVRDFLGMNDAWIQTGHFTKDDIAPPGFDVELKAIWSPPKTRRSVCTPTKPVGSPARRRSLPPSVTPIKPVSLAISNDIAFPIWRKEGI